jgi:hypothetical protein
MFATESLYCVRGTLFIPLPPALDPQLGMLIRQSILGGTQFVQDPYPHPTTSIVVPVDVLGDAGPRIRFRALIPLGANLGYYRVRALNSWSVTVPSGAPCTLRLNAYARIVKPGYIEQIVSDFDTPNGAGGFPQAGNAAAGPFVVYYNPIDPVVPVPCNAGDLFELSFRAEVMAASAIPGDTCTVTIDNNFPVTPGAGGSACEIDTGIVGF